VREVLREGIGETKLGLMPQRTGARISLPKLATALQTTGITDAIGTSMKAGSCCSRGNCFRGVCVQM